MKRILGSLFIISLFCSQLVAGVKAFVDKEAIYSGDSVRYTISIEGKNPVFPNINKIAGYNIQGTSSSKNMSFINGNSKITTSKTYTFSPDRSLDIPSYNVSIDGKNYATDEVAVRIVKPTASKQGDKFSVNIVVNKSDVYVGEPIKVDVNFKYKLNARADKIMLDPLKISNFWIKSTGKPVQSSKNDMIIQTYHYIVFPQKQGDFEIGPVKANIGNIKVNSGGNFFNDPFFNMVDRTMQWRKFVSNKLSVHVKPLPNSLEVYGDFDFKVSADKTEVKANKPVNLTLKIVGEGNIDDVKKFLLDIDGVVVYSDEPTIETGLRGEVYGGTFIQKVALIADKDFVIPSMSFSYFDKATKKRVVKKTFPINIKVNGGEKINQIVKLDTNQKDNAKPIIVVKNSDKEFLYLFIGLLLGILVTIGYFKFLGRKSFKKEISIIQKIKKSKGDRELFDLLLPFQNDSYIQSKLEILEGNIYGKLNKKVDKKEIIEHFLEVEESL